MTDLQNTKIHDKMISTGFMATSSLLPTIKTASNIPSVLFLNKPFIQTQSFAAITILWAKLMTYLIQCKYYLLFHHFRIVTINQRRYQKLIMQDGKTRTNMFYTAIFRSQSNITTWILMLPDQKFISGKIFNLDERYTT